MPFSRASFYRWFKVVLASFSYYKPPSHFTKVLSYRLDITKRHFLK